MKKPILIFILFVSCVNAKALDSLNVGKNKRFIVGVSVTPVSIDFWDNTGGLLIIGQSGSDAKPAHRTSSFLRPFGLTLGCKIYKTIYFQTGGIFTEQFIKTLEPYMPQPKQTGYEDIYSYKSDFFQIPVSISYTTKGRVSPYVNIGVKNNFIYNEHLYGVHIISQTYNTGGSINVIDEWLDISDKTMRLKSIVPFINLGLITWTKKRSFGFIYSFSYDFPPMYSRESTIPNYSFTELSVLNLKVLYRF